MNANNPKDPQDRVQIGLDHFGFHVEDQDIIGARIEEVYAKGAPQDLAQWDQLYRDKGSRPG